MSLRQSAPSRRDRPCQESDHRRSYAFDHLSAIAAILDHEGTIIDTNAAWRLFTRLNDGLSASTGTGTNYVAACERAAANGSEDAEVVAAGLRDILDGRSERFDTEYLCETATERRWFLLSASAAPQSGGAGVVLFHADITARKALEERLSSHADIDELTGLPNRRAAFRSADLQLDAAPAAGAPVTLMVLGLNLDSVNREHGRRVGDRLLASVASRVRHAIRAGDVLCRFSGDEFALVCPMLTAREADVLACRLSAAMATPFQFDATELAVTMTIATATADRRTTAAALFETARSARGASQGSGSSRRRARRRAVASVGTDVSEGATPRAESDHETQHLLAELQAARAKTDAILAHSSDLIVLFGVDGTIDWASPAATSVFGIEPEELVGRNGLSFIHSDDRDRVLLNFGSLAAMGDQVCTEFRVLRPDGTEVWVEGTATNLLDQPDVGKIVGNLRNITERRAAEDAVRLRSSLLEAVGEAIIAVDTGGIVIFWNAAAEATYGWRSSEAIGSPVADLLPAVDGWEPMAEEISERLKVGDAWSGEFMLRKKDGSEMAIMVTDTPVYDDAGALVATIGVSSDVTVRRASEATAARLSAIVEGSHDAIVSHDLDGVIATWNGGATELFGYDEAAIVGRDLSDLVAPDSAHELVEMLCTVARGRSATSIQTIGRRADGTDVHIAVRISPIKDAAGAVVGASTIARDISESVELRQRIDEDRRRLGDAQASARLGSFELDTATGTIVRSDELWRILGMEPGSLDGVDFDHFHPDDRAEAQAALAAAVADRTRVELTHRIVRPDGTVRWVVSRTSGFGDSSTTLSGTMLDITEQHEAEMALAYQAMHDTLTGLQNRNCLSDRLRSELAGRGPDAPAVAVAIIDLDQFKSLNDSLGHGFGDLVLRSVADRLREELAPGDGIYRLGGDEFVVVRDGVRTDAGANEFGLDVQSALARPIRVGERDLELSASVGVARSTTVDTAESLLRDADTAMYQAKSDGKARVVAFDAQGRERAHRRQFLETELRQALRRDQLRLEFQPVIDLGSLRVAGFESLLRWDHPDFGPVGPDEFIPIAEESGQIVEIGDWVLQRSLEQLARWHADPRVRPDLWLAVNLSARQLSEPTLVSRLAATIERTGVSAECVHLEITESVFVDRVAHGVATITALHQLGARISMDDFGTGYSSLSYLHRLPIDTLKIDRCFVRPLSADGDHSIVRAIGALAASMDLAVVAEGVETTAQFDIVRGVGCRFGQGFLWSRPLPAPEAIAWALEYDASHAISVTS